MQVFHYHAVKGNFGDDLNHWLWHDLFGETLKRAPDTVLVGVGTILYPEMYDNHPSARRFICLGSGAGYGDPLRDMQSSKWAHKVVRGPLSARILGLNEENVGTDGAIYLSILPRFQQAPVPSGKVIFIPHHFALQWPHWEQACNDAGVTFVSPEQDSLQVLETIRSARLVIADSMHAAICADVFRVPWVAVSSSSRINSFKWTDWAQSMQLSYEAEELPAPTFSDLGFELIAPALGERLRVRTLDPEQVFSAYLAQQSSRARPASRFRRKQALRLHHRLIAPVATRLDRFSPAKGRGYSAMVDTLFRLSGRAGMLSTERRFAERLDLMLDHRDTVSQLLVADRTLRGS